MVGAGERACGRVVRWWWWSHAGVIDMAEAWG